MMKIKNNTLFLNGQSITFIHRIRTVMKTPQGYLVLLDHWKNGSTGHCLYDNVFMVSEDLAVLWQIKGRKPRAYVDIFFYDNEYHAVDVEGASTVPDMSNGIMIREDFVK
ncbi:hypothetical protein ACLVWU_12470 [Bdellovibrio sp. HCB290]|uniref:hypothetical protein n=1 Tax=Bdellovibrio sp. HCB290 TaxID=3394356 RepID=UPI0039B43CAB